MRARRTSLFVSLLMLAITGSAIANPIATILKTDGTSGPLTVGINTPFDVSIYIYSDVSLSGAQMFFTELSGLGYLTVNTVTWESNSVWDTSWVLPDPGGGAGPYVPQESPDDPPAGFQLDGDQAYSMDMYRWAVGYSSGVSPALPGWKWATLNLTASQSGTFTLQLAGLVFGDINIDPIEGSTGAAFTIQAGSGGGESVPAPGAAVLAFVGMNIVGYLKRPRRKDLVPASD